MDRRIIIAIIGAVGLVLAAAIPSIIEMFGDDQPKPGPAVADCVDSPETLGKLKKLAGVALPYSKQSDVATAGYDRKPMEDHLNKFLVSMNTHLKSEVKDLLEAIFQKRNPNDESRFAADVEFRTGIAEFLSKVQNYAETCEWES